LLEMPPGSALIVIDVQKGFDDPTWGRRNNPHCEQKVAELIRVWRDLRWPVVFVRHDSREPGSPLSGGQPGNEFKSVISGEPSLLVTKHVNSAFYGKPSLMHWLDDNWIGGIVLAGIQTNVCVETTARMAGNLGYTTYFAVDATHTFDRRTPDGSVIAADELARVTAANLHGEFALVTSTAEIVDAARVAADASRSSYPAGSRRVMRRIRSAL
jgi:nicotinamidase-related amidase